MRPPVHAPGISVISLCLVPISRIYWELSGIWKFGILSILFNRNKICCRTSRKGEWDLIGLVDECKFIITCATTTIDDGWAADTVRSHPHNSY